MVASLLQRADPDVLRLMEEPIHGHKCVVYPQWAFQPDALGQPVREEIQELGKVPVDDGVGEPADYGPT